MVEIDVLIEGKKYPRISSSVALVKEVMLGENNYYLLDTGSLYDRSELISALAERNLKPKDIQHVLLSHWHVDHIGNIDLFSNSEIITTEDCINTNIKLNGLIDSLKSEDKVEELTGLLVPFFRDSGNSFAKLRAMSNLSIRHKVQIACICEALNRKRIRLLNDSHNGIISSSISVCKFDYHTKEDMVTKIQSKGNSVFFMGDLVLDFSDRQYFAKHISKNLDIAENDIIIPGHGGSFYWRKL